MNENRKCPYEPEKECLGKHCDLPKLVTFLDRCWIVLDEKAKERREHRSGATPDSPRKRG